jgi:hypothetical protein
MTPLPAAFERALHQSNVLLAPVAAALDKPEDCRRDAAAGESSDCEMRVLGDGEDWHSRYARPARQEWQQEFVLLC